jgi:uncharacterized integral membrane protein (TIGR00698 family)
MRLGIGMFRILPGLLLCAVVSVAALALQHAEAMLFGRGWIEALVLAILVGTAIRSLWTPSDRWQPGIDFSGKFLLEVAVVLLGVSLSGQAVAAAGPWLLAGIVGVVFVSLAATYALGRAAGLPKRMAVLVASGNSICGNSAIAVVAPVIGAKASDVASAIAFTAVLSVAVVLILPVLASPLGLGAEDFGIVAGLTVYAVPQVLAATAPLGALAMQVGTMVKLVRVLMLGPLVLVLSMAAARRGDSSRRPGRLPPLHRIVPWFIVGFLLLALLRSLGLVPELLLRPTALTSSMLMVISMAALGLGVDVRAVAAAGRRVSLVVTLSLLLLGAMALALVRLLSSA